MEPSPAEEMTLCLAVRIAFVVAQRLLFLDLMESQLHHCSKEIYNFIQQWCIKSKSDSKDIYNVTKDFCFK